MTAARLLLAVGGFAVLGLATYDALRTTLAPAAGGGPLSARLPAALWRLARWLARSPRSWSLAVAGTAILLATVLVWIVLLWLGWTMLLLAAPSSVAGSHGEPANLPTAIYYAGFTLFTLGVGDVHPVTALAQVLTPLASLHGLFLVTLSITYLLPVLAAEVGRRQQAAQISGMGGSAVEIVQRSWDGHSFDWLQQQLMALAPQLLSTVERHPTYPVLHYFHSPRARTAFAPQVAALDEAVTILQFGVEPAARPHPLVLFTIRNAVRELLHTLQAALRENAADVPAPPDLAPLREAGVPVVSDEEFAGRLAQLAEHRGRLHALVLSDGWVWQATEVGLAESAHEMDAPWLDDSPGS